MAVWKAPSRREAKAVSLPNALIWLPLAATFPSEGGRLTKRQRHIAETLREATKKAAPRAFAQGAALFF